MKVLDLELSRGDTGRWNLAFSVPLTGAKLWFTAKRNVGDTDSLAVISLSTTAGGITITDAAAGLAQLVIPSSATASLLTPLPPAALYLFYDIQLREADATVTTMFSGKLRIMADITQSTT
jgi:hypothetical protein